MQINNNHFDNPLGLALNDDNVKKVLNISSEFVNIQCHQLFKNTPIKYFGYYRYYDSGCMCAYVSNPLLTVDLMHEDLMPSMEDIHAFHQCGVQSTFLSHNVPPPPGMKNINFERFQGIVSRAADHGSYNALVVMDRFETYYRYCIFAVETSHHSIFNFYINYFNQLKAFVKYFESNSHEVFLSENSSNRIILPNYHVVNETSNDCLDIFQKNCFNFLNREKINIPFNPSLITSREKDCLSLIARGFTMKSAAKKLNISHRTVEQHLRNVKVKLQLNTKNELLEAWYMLEDQN